MTQNKYHLIGIGGIGMSSLARILLQKNFKVTGSDLSSTYVTEGLVKEGAHIFQGQSADNVPEGAVVVYSTDIKKDNPEFQEALRKQNPMLHRSDLLAQFLAEKKGLGIAGTHGKTTTTSLLTSVMMEGGFDPSYAVGGILPQFHSNGGHGQGEFFVAEADESDGSFLKYSPFGAIVTNIDNDHIDHYRTAENLERSFKTFMGQVTSPNHLVWCHDDLLLKGFNEKGVSYGFSLGSQAQITHFHQEGWRITYDLTWNNKVYKDIEVSLVGKHNALNSAAVFVLASLLGVSEKAIRKGLREFGGVMRRCEKKGEIQGVLFLDDYAHHPTEIAATLKGIRQAVQERRLIAVFQPHRYTRMRDCLGQFGEIFAPADQVFVTEIFAARENPIPGVDSQKIIDEIRKDEIPCRLVERGQLVGQLAEFLQPHDVVVSLGAGDITKLGPELLKELKSHPLPKLNVGVVFGGQSVEHEVSVRSANHVINSLNPDIYHVVPFGIAKSGKWVSEPGLPNHLGTIPELDETALLSPEVLEKINICDLFFPVLHGPFGEDGTIQGFFEMLGKPYVGCGHQACAVAMDKALVKKLMLLNGIATSPFCDFSARDWKEFPAIILDQIEKQLSFPLFVKPVHLGSSVGITKVTKKEELIPAIELAFRHDFHVLVENGIQGRELEFAVQGNDSIKAYPPGEVLTNGNVYDYISKYGVEGTPTTPQAELGPELIEEGIYAAEMAYKAAGCAGMARVDFFLDQQNKYWLSEINPIPGFTSISLYPQICAVQGLPGRALMDRLIILALHKKREQTKITQPFVQATEKTVLV